MEILPTESCCIRSCRNFGIVNENVELYPLPESMEEKALWKTAFGLTSKELLDSSTRVCGAHFRRKYFLEKNPVNGSGPVLQNNPAPPNVVFSTVNTPQVVNITGVSSSSSNGPFYMAFKNTQDVNTYTLRIPERVRPQIIPEEIMKGASSVLYPSNSVQSMPQTSKPFLTKQLPQSIYAISNTTQPYPANNQLSPSIYTVSDNNQPYPTSNQFIQNVYTVPSTNKVHLPNNHLSPNVVISNTPPPYSANNQLSPKLYVVSNTPPPYPAKPQVSPHVYTVPNSSPPPYPTDNHSSENVHVISSKAETPEIHLTSNSVHEPLTDESSPVISRTFSIIDSCDLYCQEESLTPEQEKFHHEEWLNYVKFKSNVQNLPYVSVVKGSDFGEKISDGIASSQELPLLLYSNAQPQTDSTSSLSTPAPNSETALNSPSILNSVIPVSNPGHLSPNPAVTAVKSSVANSSNPVIFSINPEDIPSGTQISVFPVKLEQSNRQVIEKPPVPENKEEVLPLIIQDPATESLFNQVKEASLILPQVSEADRFESPLVIDEDLHCTENLSASPLSGNFENDSNMSPDLLKNVEVNFEENDFETLPATITEPAPTILGAISLPTIKSGGSNVSSILFSPSSDLNVEEGSSNGPKIVDVLCGDAVASEFYNMPEKNNSISELEKNNSPAALNTTPAENLLPRTVTQFSIFSMQKTIAVISSGSVEANIRNLLGVRIHIPPITTERDLPTKLKNRLREENFLTLCPWWLCQRRYLPLYPPCTTCGGKRFRLNSCPDNIDSLCWLCENTICRKIYPVKRPKFFERFPSFTLEELLLLTYHWACKSRIWVISYDVPVHPDRVWEYFCALQDLCGESVSRNNFIGQNTKHMVTVEVSAVKLGKFFILCAYDRRNKVSRLKAITTEEACGSVKHIQVLEEWLGNNCTLITWKKISDEFLPNVIKVSADPAIGHVQSPGRHILNASKYLGRTMVQLFQNICHDQLTLETVQRVLDEVQWRERNGKTEEAAFWNILSEISQLNDPSGFTEAVLGDIKKDRYFYKADMPFRLRWGPIEYPIKNTSVKSKTVFLTGSDAATCVPVSAPSPLVLASKDIMKFQPASSVQKVLKPDPRHPISVVVPDTSKEIRTPPDVPISSKDLLSIKIYFSNEEHILKTYESQAEKLAKRLRNEGYIYHPVKWLCEKGYLTFTSSCYACGGPSKLQDNKKFPDGVGWTCLKSVCRFENAFQRPSFFSFGFRLEVILAIIFHWAVQSDYQTLIKAVPMNEFNILGVHRRLQKVCAETMKGSAFKIGGKRALVEVAFVRFANCFILGAMERCSKFSRFCTFPSEVKLHIDAIRKTLISWLWEKSTVVVNSNKYLGRYCMEEKINLVFADQTVTDVNSKKYHTLTITNYLQNHIKTMFRSIKVQSMSSELLQVYLDELVWRERYGRNPDNAFYSIMNCIFAVENGDLSIGTALDDATVIQQAAEFYDLPLPLPELKVVIEKLPDHVIHNFTKPAQIVTIVDEFELTKKIKQEVVSDDEIEIVGCVSLPPPSSLPSSSSSLTSSSSPLEVKISAPPVPTPSQSSLVVQPSTHVLPPLPPLIIPSTSAGTSKSYDAKKQRMTPIQIPSPRTKIKDNVVEMKSEDNSSYKRYADKCYGQRKRASLSDGRSRCIECKDVVSADHFVKQYSCSDCKLYVYSTYCQKAFARHRSYILFRRKIANDYHYNRNIRLADKWYCSCGYNSKEGNKLASHLIECEKSTCYLKPNDDSAIL